MIRYCRSPKPFTLIELLIVIGIIALLASLLLPALSRAKKMAQASKCLSNMKNISLAFTAYNDSYDEFFPLANPVDAPQWTEEIAALSKTTAVFYCPTDSGSNPSDWSTDPKRVSYGYNFLALGFYHPTGRPHPNTNDGVLVTTHYATMPAIRQPVETLVITETGLESDKDQRGYYLGIPVVSDDLWDLDPKDFIPNQRHVRTLNTVFAEGHAEAVRVKDLVLPDQTTNAAPINNYRRWSPIR